MRKAGAISRHICGRYSGISADLRVFLQKSRKYAIEYYSTYLEDVPSSHLCKELSIVVQEFTQSSGVRPFGIYMLKAGYDFEGPQLYRVPSKTFFSWKSCGYWKNMINAKSFLEKGTQKNRKWEMLYIPYCSR